MRVYHFLNKKYGLESIRERHLKISKLDELNDPFEFFAFNAANQDVRGAIDYMKNTLSTNRGIICFSENWFSPLLWGHYADKHGGICLGFDIPPKLLRKIEYISERQEVDPSKLDIEWTQKLLFSKFNDWKYEEEQRLWLSLKKPNKAGLYFRSYSRELVLKEIVVGCQSDITRKDISDAMGDNFPHIKPHKARAAFQKFEIIKNKNSNLWK